MFDCILFDVQVIIRLFVKMSGDEQEMSLKEEEQIELNTIKDEMKRRDSLKVYVSNVGNYMQQREVVKLLSEHHVPGIK